MSKLEVYTFGSAASHFSNPHRSPKHLTNPTKSEPGTSYHVISHIEQYASPAFSNSSSLAKMH